MIYNNISEAVGHTPMVQLNRMTGPEDARVLVKFEGLNVGGSIKTRTALNMIEDAEKRGWLKPDSIETYVTEDGVNGTNYCTNKQQEGSL